MNNKKRIALDVIVILLGIVFLVFGIRDAIDYYKKTITPDNIKLKNDFQGLNKNNNFKYINISKLKKNKENILLLYGSKYDSWTQILMPILDNISKDKNINIYYLDIEKNNSDSKENRIPNIIFLNKTDIKKNLKYDDIYDDNYKGAPIDYWNKDRIEEFKNIIFNCIDIYNIPKIK